MKYEPQNFEKIKIGDVTEVTITSIEQDTIQKLMPQKMIDASTFPIDLDGIVLRVTTESGLVEFFNVPKDNILNPKSKLSRFFNQYGTYPQIDMKIKTIIGGEGFEKIVIA